MWRKGARRLLEVPNMTRSTLVPRLIDTQPPVVQICKRFMNMRDTVYNGDNYVLRFIFESSIMNRGIIWRNCKYAQLYLMTCLSDINVNEDANYRLSMLDELSNCNILSRDETVTISNYILTY